MIPGAVGAGRVEIRPDIPKETNRSPVTPLVEYRVSGASGQAAISKFLAQRESTPSAPGMTLINARKVLDGGRLSEPEVLMVRHSEPGDDLRHYARFARTIACCTTRDDPSVNHVFRGWKDEAGKAVVGDVRLHVNGDASAVAFTKSDTISLPGYERSIVLNGGSRHQVGIKAQNGLYSWLREPVPAGAKIEPGSLLDRKARLHGILNDYDMLQTERDSAADRAGIDLLFVHKASRKMVVVDMTLDLPNKRGNSDFRNSTIFQIQLEKQTIHGGAKIETLSAGDRERFLDHLDRALKAPSPLNLNDTMPPSHLANKSEAEKSADITRYRQAIAKKAERLRIQADADGGKSAVALLSREQLAQLQGYLQDLQPAVSYSRAHEKVSFDPNREARTAHLEEIVQDRIRAVVRQQAAGTNTVNVSHGGRGNYDSQYDRYIVPYGNVSYVVENFTGRIRGQIGQEIERAKSIEAKRRLTLDSVEFRLRTRIVDELNLIEPHELLGEKRPYTRNAADGGRMKPRDDKDPQNKGNSSKRPRSGFIKGSWVG
jgi:hypothetical protein